MARSRKFLTVGALGVAALALIGAGAGATFSDSASSAQRIAAGTMSLLITSDGGVTSADNRSVTMPDVGAVGSTFETHNRSIVIKNTGDITVTEVSIKLSDTNSGSGASSYLRSQLNVCMSDGESTFANGPLLTGESLSPSVDLNPITLRPLQTETLYVDFYAGMDASRCVTRGSGKIASSASPYTANRWGEYTTPESLTNDAMGGVVTPKLTFSFKG